MQENEIYNVSQKTYNALYAYCSKLLLAAQAEISHEPYATESHFTGAAFSDDVDAYSAMIERLNYEYVPTELFKEVVNCSAADKQGAISKLFRQITVGRNVNISPKYQYVSQETYNRILAMLAETLLYDFSMRNSNSNKLTHKYLDEDMKFYEWFSGVYESSSRTIIEMIESDGALSGMITDLANRTDDFDELIIDIMNTYRVKPV